MEGKAAAEGARDAHEPLMRALDGVQFEEAIAHGPSALPGWTIPGYCATGTPSFAASAMRLAPSDSSLSTVVMRVGDGDPEGFVTVVGTSREVLAWTLGRFAGEPHWPALAPWRGLP